MRMAVVLTKREFEEALAELVGVHDPNTLVEGIYQRIDGGIEFTLTTLEGPTERELAGETPRPRLWTPDPPPFIHSVEPAAEVPPRKPGDFYPPFNFEKESNFGETVSCKCRKFKVTEVHGWVDSDMTLHTIAECEPAPINDAAALSASTTGEHGTIDSDDDTVF